MSSSLGEQKSVGVLKYGEGKGGKKTRGNYILIQYLPNQWIAIFARFDWLSQLGISLERKMARCFVKISEEEIEEFGKH